MLLAAIKRAPRWPIVLSVLSAVVSVVVVLLCPLQVDELGSWGMSNGGFGEAFERSVVAQGQGPLYYLLLSIWINFFGDSRLALRLPSILFGTSAAYFISIVIFSVVGRRWISLTAVTFLVLSPLWVLYMVLARPYPLATFEVALSLYVAMFVRRGSYRFTALGLIGIATFLTHYFFVLSLLACAVLGSLYGNSPRRWREAGWNTLSVVGGSFLGLAVIAMSFGRHLSTISSISFLGPPTLVALIGLIALLPLYPLPLVVLAIAFSKRLKLPLSSGILEFSCALLLVFSLFLGAHLLGATLLLHRYVMIGLVPAALCFGRMLQFAENNKFPGVRLLVLVHAIFVGLASYKVLVSDGVAPGSLHLRLVRSIEDLHNRRDCPSMLSSDFIESIDPQRLSQPSLQPFLRSPFTYFGQTNFELLPLGFQDPELVRHYVEKIEEKVRESGCVQIVLYTHWFQNKLGPIIPSYIALHNELQSQGYIIDIPNLSQGQTHLVGFVYLPETSKRD